MGADASSDRGLQEASDSPGRSREQILSALQRCPAAPIAKTTQPRPAGGAGQASNRHNDALLAQLDPA